ncbi:MAG: kelch repeat-containing protein [Planctomycetota bacterium]
MSVPIAVRIVATTVVVFPAAAQFQWKPILDPDSPTRARAHHGMAHDPVGDQLVVFAGQASVSFSGFPPATSFEEFSWTDADGWRSGLSSQPPLRDELGMAAHGGAQHVVMFGGRQPGAPTAALGDTWIRVGSWRQIEAATRPSARWGHTMGEEGSGGVVLFGGRDATGVMGDTWRWDGAGWLALTPATAPPAREGHGVAFDAGRGRAVLFGGRDAAGGLLADTWEWDGNGWVQLAPAGVAPSARAGHALAYDAVAGRVVLFGGEGAGGALGDTWTFDGAQWRATTPAVSPPPTYGHAMATDPASGAVMLHGGTDGALRFGDLWSWDGARWSRRSKAGPEARSGSAVAYDTQRRELLAFGGAMETYSGYGSVRDLWRWDGDGWAERLPVGGPPLLAGGFGAYDSARDRFVVVGSMHTAEWDGTRWTERSSPELPGSLQVVDRRGRGRVMGAHLNGAVFEWDGTVWTPVTAPGGPPQALGVAYDSMRDRLVVFAGPDMYEWDGASWLRIPAVGAVPEFGRLVMVYDPVRQHVVASGGVSYGGQETWEWDGVVWSQSSRPGPGSNSGFAMTYDPDRQWILQFSGVNSSFSFTEDDRLHAYASVAPAQYASFGAGCLSLRGVPVLDAPLLPCVGAPFRINLFSVPPGAPSFLLFGRSDQFWVGGMLPLDLGAIGGTGCQLLVSPDVAVPMVSLTGQSFVNVRLTNPSLLGAQWFNQAAVIAPTVGPLGIAFSEGRRAVVGGF